MSQAESGEKLRGDRGKGEGGKKRRSLGRREGVELESGRRLLLWPDVKLSRLSVFLLNFNLLFSESALDI